MKKILGLDLGVSSIGWAYVLENDDSTTILGGGVRIVPLSVDEKDEFSSGKAISKNMKRSMRRGARRNLFRYKLRKKHLSELFRVLGILPSKELFTEIDKQHLWALRGKAATEQISLEEFARVLFHLNQKRGFKSNRKANQEEEEGKKLSEYKQELKKNEDELLGSGLTIGQFFSAKLNENPSFRIRNKVFPRSLYENEFDQIWKVQAEYYPEVLTDALRKQVRDKIIFFQRRLKSQKALVSFCPFEGKMRKDASRRERMTGPRVAPVSSPIHQLCKIWESVNNLRIKDQSGNVVPITPEQRHRIIEKCQDSSAVSQNDIFKILGLSKDGSYRADAMVKAKGIQGNTTVQTLRKVLTKHGENTDALLNLPLKVNEIEVVNEETGEISSTRIISDDIYNTGLYQLWHAIYSIEDDEALEAVLIEKFGIGEPAAKELCGIDFTKQGFAGKSTKAMRKILPYLMQGEMYAKACELAGYRHSDFLTREENLIRPLADKLMLLRKGELRQPVVEKILNQLINLVNALMADARYGRPDEVRIELARELKQNIQQRKNTYKRNNDRDKEHKKIDERLSTEYGIRKVSRALIEKYKLYQETDGISLYSGKRMEISRCLNGEDVDIDHIVPKSLLFDDSFNNRTLCEGWINRAKGNMTAYEFMKKQPIAGLQPFDAYMEMLKKLNEKKEGISNIKLERFSTDADGIPGDFIERQLRQTAYISRQAAALLKEVVRHVYFTSGTVTDFLREKWGWNDVLKNLNWDKYSAMGLTRVTEHNHRIIEGWSKRDDHRHHFIDALVVACTKQKYIQALNNLSQVSRQIKEFQLPTIDRMIEERPFRTAEVEAIASRIFISIKKGKRLASQSRNKETGQRLLIPRGPLSEETIYGKIKIREKVEVSLNAKYDPSNLVADPVLKKLVRERLSAFNNDPAKAFKKPLFADPEQRVQIKKVPVWTFVDEYVVKYKVEGLKAKDIPYVVDKRVRERLEIRLAEFNGNEKEAFKNIEANPVYMDDAQRIPVRSVRLRTGLSKVEAIHQKADGTPVDFVKPGNNAYFIVTRTSEGTLEADAITFMEAFERRRQGESMKDALAREGKELLMSFESNEYCILGLDKKRIDDLINSGAFDQLTPSIYRVQKFTKKGDGTIDIWFRQQYQTKLNDDQLSKNVGLFINFRNVNALLKGIPYKINVNVIGDIRID